MKIILAPDSFKESLSSIGVVEAMERGIRRIASQAVIDKIPLADGGEGTLEALIASTSGSIRPMRVTGPMGEKTDAFFGLLGDGKTGVVEMASASGLMLVPKGERNPMTATSFGTGELLRAALERSLRKIIVCIGGSATSDCGTGMIQALGAKFYRKDASEISEPMNGGLMGEASRIDTSGLLPGLLKSLVLVACDVQNPLLGQTGAVRMYSRQKGADEKQLDLLETNMEHMAGVFEKEADKPIRNIPGTGAAGGLAVPLIAFAKAELQSGIRLVLEACGFAERIRKADLILTGEGCVDQQTAFGKTIRGVAAEARKQSVPVVALAGSIEKGAENLYDLGLTSMFSICTCPMALEQSIQNAASLIEDTAERVVRLFMTNCNNSRH